MSKQIDVLVVLRRAFVKLDLGHGIESANLAIEVREASAAIAELIEAADKYLDDSRLESRLNLIDALKAVQGPQA